MKKGTDQFDFLTEMVTDYLFQGFLSWNDIQGELWAKGFPNKYVGDAELEHERAAYRAIAERLVLEDVDFLDWMWFETSWEKSEDDEAESRIVHLLGIDLDDSLSDCDILGFSVTCSHGFWRAVPLAEVLTAGEGLTTCQVNSIWDALHPGLLLPADTL